MSSVEDTEDVDVKDLLEVVGGEFESGLDDRDTRVGSDGVDGTEVLLDLGEGRLDLVRVSDVALVGLNLAVVLLGEVSSDFLGILEIRRKRNPSVPAPLRIRSRTSSSTHLGRVVDHG